MSYYILPKNYNILTVEPTWSQEMCSPYISHSLLNFFNMINGQLIYMLDGTDISYNDVIQVINPYGYIFSKVPGSKFSVSKLNVYQDDF